MSSLVKKQAPLLHILSCAKPSLRKKILKSANTKLISSIVECVYNILAGNVNISSKEKKKLLKHKKILRNIVKFKRNPTKRKKIINQSGGSFLPALLLPIISSLITSTFMK